MTKKEAAIIQAYTGIVLLEDENLRIFYDYAENLIGRSIFTHELPKLADELKERSRFDFINLCKNLTD